MELKVNGQHVDITLEGEQTIGDVLKAFESEAAKNDATTINIRIDGNEIPAEKFDETIKAPIKESTLIELSVITKGEVLNLLENSAGVLKVLSEKLKELPVLLQGGKDPEAGIIITELAGEIDAFCHAATLSALFPELYNGILIDGKELGPFFEELAPILKDFEDAYENKDTVTIGDLAEYEISPRLITISESIANLKN